MLAPGPLRRPSADGTVGCTHHTPHADVSCAPGLTKRGVQAQISARQEAVANVRSVEIPPSAANAGRARTGRPGGQRMNRVLITGRLTRDPEMRKLATGKTVTQFSVATNDYRGGAEKAEYHSVVTWDRLAEICGQYLGKGQMVNIEGRLQTRQWEDENKLRHWKTEIVANAVEMLSGRRKKDYAAESAA